MSKVVRCDYSRKVQPFFTLAHRALMRKERENNSDQISVLALVWLQHVVIVQSVH